MTPHAELDQLSAYIDGELDAQERASVDAHLPTCAECRSTLDALKATIADLGTLPELAPTEQDSWALRSAIAQARKPVRRWQRMVVAAGSVAAVGIAIAAFVFSGGGNADKSLEALRNAGGQALTAGGTAVPIYTSSENFTLEAAHQHLLAVSGKVTNKDSRMVAPTAANESGSAADAQFDVLSAGAPSARVQSQIDRCVDVVTRSTQQLLTPFRYEVVTFEKKPAFFLIFSTTDRFELWVVGRDRCDVLYFAQAA